MRTRHLIAAMGVFAVIVLGACAIAIFGGYRLNLTPSEALGLWRIAPLERPVAKDDLVFVCPPATSMFEVARERGYLRRGLCPYGLAPLLKTGVALPGDYVEIGSQVVVDGVPIPASSIRTMDGAGRSIAPFAGGVVPPDHLFLHSSFASSYDSRYFGPIPASGLLGLARPVLTFDPR